MTGYIGKNEEAIGVVTDYVNDSLAAFVRKLIVSYAGISYRETKCGLVSIR